MKCWCCQLSPVIFDPFWTQTRKFLEFAFCLTLFMPVQFSSVTLLCPDYLRPNGVYHTRLLCPSPTSEASSHSCPLSQWCHSTISSSVIPFFHLQSFPASGSFPLSQLFASVGQSCKLQLQHQSFQWIFRTDFLLDGLVGSPSSPRDFQEASPTPQFKSTGV